MLLGVAAAFLMPRLHSEEALSLTIAPSKDSPIFGFLSFKFKQMPGSVLGKLSLLTVQSLDFSALSLNKCLEECWGC